jgi:hypothetical protein
LDQQLLPVVKLRAIPVLYVNKRLEEFTLAAPPKNIEFSIRLKPVLHRRLARDAKQSGTTINAEIVKRLEASYVAADSATFADTALQTFGQTIAAAADKAATITATSTATKMIDEFKAAMPQIITEITKRSS